MNKSLVAGLAVGLLVAGMAEMASATIYHDDVYAYENSSSGGVGLDLGVNLNLGQLFTVSTGEGDLWSAGALPRVSDADGLVGDFYATGTEGSGLPAGTLIGQSFGLWTQANLSAPYGSLVGEIGGVYALLGKSFNGSAWNAGNLKLYYWDSNYSDNYGAVHVTVNDNPSSPVPEPATMLLFGTGLAGLAGAVRRKKA